jgi:hypothetical protein
MPRLLPMLLAAALLAAPAARADEVADALREASRAYAAGDLNAARLAIEEAQQALAKRSAGALAAALPAPLAGWTAREAETQAGGAMFLAGLSQAQREYRNAQGQTVQVTIMADHPMIAQVAMLLNSPAMLGAVGRMVRIGNQRALQMPSGEIQMVVNNRFLVQIEGSAPVEAKLAYARAIDLAKLPG